MNYKEELQMNNDKLLNIVNKINNLSGIGATATAEDVLQGKTAYVNGEKIEGIIPISSSKQIIIPTSEDQDLMLKNYYIAEDIIVKGDKNLKPENIVKGKTIFGIDGNYTNLTSGIIIAASSSYSIIEITYYDDWSIHGLSSFQMTSNQANISYAPKGSVISLKNTIPQGRVEIYSASLLGLEILNSTNSKIDLIILNDNFSATINWTT